MYIFSLLMLVSTYIHASPQSSIPWKQLHKDIDYSLKKETGKSYSDNYDHYYPKMDLNNPKVINNLREKLNKVLNSAHIVNELGQDQLTDNCDNTNEQTKCYDHRVYDYRSARKLLFGKIYLKTFTSELSTTKNYYVTDQYCHQDYSNTDIYFDEFLRIGPQQIPNPNIINTEHLWPKSRFNHTEDMPQSYNYPYEMKLSDLHHLIPTDSRANGDRSSYKFGEVEIPMRDMKCSSVQLGTLADSDKDEYYFEPPHELKGDIARSLFYFSLKYEVPITNTEESFLRAWHRQDPVSDFEKVRNNIIHDIQGLRNPFIDYPQIEEAILEF